MVSAVIVVRFRGIAGALEHDIHEQRMPAQRLGKHDACLRIGRREPIAVSLQVTLHVYARGQEIRQQDDVVRPLLDAVPGGVFNRRLGEFEKCRRYDAESLGRAHALCQVVQVVIRRGMAAAVRDQQQRGCHGTVTKATKSIAGIPFAYCRGRRLGV